MQKNISFQKLVYSDLKRKYNHLPRKLPENKVGLARSVFIFFIGSKSFRSIFFYRLMVKYKNNRITSQILEVLRRLTFNIPIAPTARIDEGFLIGHPEGVNINTKCEIGKNFTIQQAVTIGYNIGKIRDGRVAPLIGDNVFVGSGARILGPVVVGDNCMIGANAVVVKDIPKDSVAVGVPAKVVKKVDEPYNLVEKRIKKSLMKSNQ